MTDVEIVHPVPVAEALAWFASMATTFLEDPSPESQPGYVEALRRLWTPDRRWGARSHGRWVGTLGTLERTVTVPGGDLAVDALTMVTVAATHRRQGILRSMLTDSLHRARERGDAASVLIAAEWSIYGRFGYSPAELTAAYSLDPRRPGASVTANGLGRMRQVDGDEFGAIAPSVFERARHQRAGNIDRPSTWWDRVLGRDGLIAEKIDGRLPVHVVHEGPAGVDGYVSWTATSEFDADGSLGSVRVTDLSAANDEAYRALWAYLTGMDLVGTLVLGRRPVDEPARWLLTEGRALRQTYTGDGIWVRLLDVPTALSVRRYARADELVIEVHDDAPGGYAAGRFRLEGAPDGSKCEPTATRSPDLTLDQRALASCYFGGFSLAQQTHRGMMDEHTPDAAARFDALFATRLAPWCATEF